MNEDIYSETRIHSNPLPIHVQADKVNKLSKFNHCINLLKESKGVRPKIGLNLTLKCEQI